MSFASFFDTIGDVVELAQGDLAHDLGWQFDDERLQRVAHLQVAFDPQKVMEESVEMVLEGSHLTRQVGLGGSFRGVVDAAGEEEAQFAQVSGVAPTGLLGAAHRKVRLFRAWRFRRPFEAQKVDDPEGLAIGEAEVAVVLQEEIRDGGKACFQQITPEPELELVL